MTRLVLALVACGGDIKDPVFTDTTTDTDTTATESDTNPPSAPDCTGNVSGFARDAESAPAEGVDLRFCRGSACRTATTLADGAYEFANVCVGAYSLEFTAEKDSGLATLIIPLDIADGEVLTVDGFQLPLDPATTLGSATEIEVVDGLHITVGTGDLEPPDALSVAATDIAGVAIPTELLPPVQGATTVVAGWNLHPFDYEAPAGLPVRVDNLWSLPEGGAYELWVADYTLSVWTVAGTFTVDEGSLVGIVSLPMLSTMVLVQP